MASRTDSKLTLNLLPAKEELWLDDFVEEMKNLVVALRETERLVTQRPDASLSFRINRLEKNSPAVVELEAISKAPDAERSTPTFASYVVRKMTTNLRMIGHRKLPRGIDVSTLEAYRDIASPLERRGLEVILTSGPKSIRINQDFRKAVEAVMGEDERSYGSISGRIEAMNTHGRTRFRLYPMVGPFRVLGTFPTKKRAKFAAGMDRYVTVWGTLRYKTWGKFPYAVHATDIEIHGDNCPSLLDFGGIAPNATGDLTGVEFVNRLRDEG